VDESELGAAARELALQQSDWSYLVEHGGGVANAYGWRAETECALAVANPAGLVVVWMTRKAARGVSEAGAANCCIYGAGDLWDGRITSEERREEARALMREAFQTTMPLLDQIATIAMSDD